MNLKIRVIVCMLFVIISCGEHVVRGDDTKNITRLLNNQVIVSRQIMCVLEKSPCDQLGRQLKGKEGKEKLIVSDVDAMIVNNANV